MLIGHQSQIKFLRRSLETSKMAHAYLFVGPKGVGKETVARDFINSILGGTSVNSDEWNIKYVERIDDAKTGKKHKDISVDQVRQISDFLNHFSLVNNKQVVIINEADYLSRGASNSLLKTLEEPRAQNSVTILLAESAENLLPTVVSRCQVIRFSPVPTKEIQSALEKLGADKNLAIIIARLANHKPGFALEIFNNPKELEFYRNESERFYKLHKGSLGERFEHLTELFGNKTDHIEARDKIMKVLDLWQLLWRDFYLQQNNIENFTCAIEETEKSKSNAKRYSPALIQKVLEEIIESGNLIRQNIHPRLILENLILTYY